MVEHGKLDNPTIDINDYKAGDFVEWLLYDVKQSFAVVTEKRKDRLILRHFEDGFPFEVDELPQYGGTRKASKEEALAYFQTVSDGFEKKLANGGLKGAVDARKQHYLNGVISKLKEETSSYYAATIAPKDPMTGLYVLMGIYSGQGPSEHLTGLKVNPRLSEYSVSKVMIELSPEGFGNIPSDVYNTPATSHGSLVTYWTYEIPEKAMELVVEPKQLNLELK